MQTHGAPDVPDPGPDGFFREDSDWDQTDPAAIRAGELTSLDHAS